MTSFEKEIKAFLEETFNQPVGSREVKRVLGFIFKTLFESLIGSGSFCFPKGFGSLRIKKLKPFKAKQKDGTMKIIKERNVIRYFSGRQIKRRIQNAG